MTAKKKETTQIVELQPLDTKTFQVKLEGVTPLLVHAFGAKVQKEIEEKSAGKGTPGKKIYNEKEEYEACFYYTNNGKYGFKAIAFKKAVVTSISSFPGMKKILGRQLFHIPAEIVEIKGKPHIHKGPVRIGRGTAIRVRPMFEKWSVILPILYNANVATPALICNLFNHAGFAVGVGENRAEKGGSNGLFRVKE